MEAVAVGYLKAKAIRVGDPNVRDTELQIIGDLLQYVGRLVVRGQNLDDQMGRVREDGLLLIRQSHHA
jgi:hypothetical protein